MRDTIGKAIYEGRNGPKCKPWAFLPRSHQEPYLVDAANALNAIRFHDVEVRDGTGVYVHELRGEPQAIWRMLVDAMLNTSEDAQ